MYTGKRSKLLPAALAAAMLAGAAADLAGNPLPGHAGPFDFPGFWSLFGLLGCFLLAGACKLAARLFLKRPENYYDDAF